MAKTEKIAFILEQVRLCLDRKDFVRYAWTGACKQGCVDATLRDTIYVVSFLLI